MQTLRGGGVLKVPGADMERLKAAALAPIVGIANTAMEDILRRTANVSAQTLIGSATEQVARGVQLVAETSQALGRIQTEVAEINGAIKDIAAAAAEQSTGLAKVNVAVAHMDQSTQKNAAMVQQSTAATRALAQEIAALANSMSRFKLQANTVELCAA